MKQEQHLLNENEFIYPDENQVCYVEPINFLDYLVDDYCEIEGGQAAIIEIGHKMAADILRRFRCFKKLPEMNRGVIYHSSRHQVCDFRSEVHARLSTIVKLGISQKFLVIFEE